MKKILIYTLFSLTITLNNALANIEQSSSSIEWKQIENEQVKIVFPSYIEEKAKYILNLINHYKKDVNKSYNQETPKFTLILRSELADFNGFVTLAPRRSEWFSSATLTPLIGSLDWYQSLSIHEFRHLAQYEYMSKENTKFGYYLFGEFGLSVLMNIMTPTWFFEGDAVWAETVYSDGGRGRSARFAQRMKALLKGETSPTLDELLAGKFDTPLPNYYVYGYFLVTYAYNKYGKDIWAKVLTESGQNPLNPYALYNSFYKITGQDFTSFYNEMIYELKKEWNISEHIISKSEKFKQEVYPYVQNEKSYHFTKSLDTLWTDTKSDKELNISPSMSKISIHGKNIIYTQTNPHYRYAYKQYADLYIFDGHTSKKLTSNKRVFHPSFSQDGQKIVYTNFDKDNNWFIETILTDGTLLNKYSFNQTIAAEAIWANNSALIIISLNDLGKKTIDYFDLETKDKKTLTAPTRNNIYNLFKYQENIYFEADYDGVVNVFSLNLKDLLIRQCTNEQLGAHTPFINSTVMHFSKVTVNGSRISKINLDCKIINNLFNIESHNKDASNFFYKKDAIKVDYKDINKILSTTTDYKETTRSLTPHSWSFVGLNGVNLSIDAQNELSTFAISAAAGTNSIESRPFTKLNLGFYKYFPLVDFSAGYRERSLTDDKSSIRDEWSEATFSLGVRLPYLFRKNTFSGLAMLGINTTQLSISNKKVSDINEAEDDQLNANAATFGISFTQDKPLLNVTPKQGFVLSSTYTNLEANQKESLNNHSLNNSIIFYLPGISQSHSIKMTGNWFNSKDNKSSYDLLQATKDPLTPNILSRGYTGSGFNNYEKFTFNYYFPLAYPSFNLWQLVHLNRIYANIFIDHSMIKDKAYSKALNSYGIELYFDTLTFRKLPLGYFIRGLHKEETSETEGEMGIYIGGNF